MTAEKKFRFEGEPEEVRIIFKFSIDFQLRSQFESIEVANMSRDGMDQEETASQIDNARNLTPLGPQSRAPGSN
jgi:hypothetical protein